MRHSLVLACALSALCVALVYPCKAEALSATTLADDTEVRFGIDFIFGAFDDRALYVSAGCEKQMFQAARGVLALDVQRPDGFGVLFEYNILPDEPKRVDGNAFYNDYYKNIGTDLYYYGDFKAKNAYLRYGKGAWQVRAGRMVNPYGFAENEVL